MAISKSDMMAKREKRRAKKERIDKLTNWFMINLSWGVVGLIALGFVERAFSNPATVLLAPNVMKWLAAVFFVLAAVLYLLGKSGVIKNKKRARDYSVFLAVLTLASLWIGFFAPIRNVAVAIIPALKNLRSEWWYVWSLRYILIAYLVVAFIVVTVKTTLAEKGK